MAAVGVVGDDSCSVSSVATVTTVPVVTDGDDDGGGLYIQLYSLLGSSRLIVARLLSHVIVLKSDHFALRPQKRGGLLGTGTGGRGRKSEGSFADTARKRPERPWTAARTTEVLRRCPLAIAQ